MSRNRFVSLLISSYRCVSLQLANGFHSSIPPFRNAASQRRGHCRAAGQVAQQFVEDGGHAWPFSDGLARSCSVLNRTGVSVREAPCWCAVPEFHNRSLTRLHARHQTHRRRARSAAESRTMGGSHAVTGPVWTEYDSGGYAPPRLKFVFECSQKDAPALVAARRQGLRRLNQRTAVRRRYSLNFFVLLLLLPPLLAARPPPLNCLNPGPDLLA